MKESGLGIDNELITIFGIRDFSTLSNLQHRCRYELGGELKGKKRFKFAYSKAVSFIKNEFLGKKIWIRLVLWDNTNIELFLDNQFKPLITDLKFYRIEDNNLIIYFCLNNYNSEKIDVFLKSSVGYELGIENTLNITCFYFNFESKVLINVYDDRGLDFIKICSAPPNKHKE